MIEQRNQKKKGYKNFKKWRPRGGYELTEFCLNSKNRELYSVVNEQRGGTLVGEEIIDYLPM